MATVGKQRAAGQKAGSPASSPFPTGVSQPALRALASAGYNRLDQLDGASEKHLAALHGMGPKALRIIGDALRERGKSFLE
jgi:hypothetical protein